MNENKKKLISDWHRRCRQSQRLNYATGNLYLKYHYIIGVISVILSCIVSSTFFTQIVQQSAASSQKSAQLITYGAGTLSIVVAVLSAFQTFFRFSEKAEHYKAISAKYGAVRRKLEQLMTQEDINIEEVDRQLDIIRSTMDDLAENALNIPNHIKKEQVADLKSEPRKNELFAPYDGKKNG